MEPAISNLTMDDYDEAVAFWRSQDGIALNESDEREAINPHISSDFQATHIALRPYFL